MSVITPVYNGERFLLECIGSVLAQTYSDWEYIIADNVSTDRTVEIAEEFAAKDSRIRVLRATEFLDIYGNHNRALCAVGPTSKYCKFLHADDLLYPRCLERMVSLAEVYSSVSVVSAIRRFDGDVELRVPLRVSQSVVSGLEAVKQELLYRAWASGSPSNFLFRTPVACEREQFFDRSVWHADNDVYFRLLMHGDLGFVHEVLTYTRYHAEAQSSFTVRVNSLRPRDGRLLLRYGRRALGPAEYEIRLRRWLLGYGLFLAAQRLRKVRRSDREFHDFHSDEIDYMLAEAGIDPITHQVLLIYRRLFIRPPLPGQARTPRRTAPLR